MVKWYLVWILTVQTYSGDIDSRPIAMGMESRTVCMQEAKVKREQLELQLGKDYYLNYNYGGDPIEMLLGGKLLGVSVGCEVR